MTDNHDIQTSIEYGAIAAVSFLAIGLLVLAYYFSLPDDYPLKRKHKIGDALVIIGVVFIITCILVTGLTFIKILAP